MGLNNHAKEPGETNANEVHTDQITTYPVQINIDLKINITTHC